MVRFNKESDSKSESMTMDAKNNTYTGNEYLRNPEIKRQLFIYLLTGIAVLSFGSLGSREALVPMLILWSTMGIFHFVESYRRYRRIAALSTEIDKILHMEDVMLLQNMDEGELCILENEVNKMLTRLRDSNLELKKEKTYLADSLADLSHQLRTPLTSMNLVLSMLEQENLPVEKQMEYYRKLQGLLGKVQWLIEVMLKISKLDADAVVFETQSCEMMELVQEAVLPLEIPMELKEIKFCCETTGEPETKINNARKAGSKTGQYDNCNIVVPTFHGDRKWTVEAIGNILKNCMEHTPAGGEIHVSVTENAIYSEIVISDNGEGIHKEDLPHLLERFYKGKNSSTDSVGIGLALANMIIVKQNGVLKVENESSGGARFSIRFYKGTM